MARICEDSRVVFGDSPHTPEIPEHLGGGLERALELLGEVTRGSFRELVRFADMLFEEGENGGLREVSLNLGLEADGKFSMPLIFEGGLGGQAGIVLTFRRGEEHLNLSEQGNTGAG